MTERQKNNQKIKDAYFEALKQNYETGKEHVVEVSEDMFYRSDTLNDDSFSLGNRFNTVPIVLVDNKRNYIKVKEKAW